MSKLESYHYVWLESHPTRTEGWLRERLKDGFCIHHIDGDHSNNHPRNLVLIEGQDHRVNLHGFGMPKKRPIKMRTKKIKRDVVRTGPSPWMQEITVDKTTATSRALRRFNRQ